MITAANRLTLSSKSDKVEMARAIFDAVMDKLEARQVEAAKAVYDAASSMIEKESKAMLSHAMKSLPADVNKSYVQGIDDKLAALRKEFMEGLQMVKMETRLLIDGLSKAFASLPVPQVNVNPPDVHIHPAKPMEKSILYDDAGRPSIITEREAKNG